MTPSGDGGQRGSTATPQPPEGGPGLADLGRRRQCTLCDAIMILGRGSAAAPLPQHQALLGRIGPTSDSDAGLRLRDFGSGKFGRTGGCHGRRPSCHREGGLPRLQEPADPSRRSVHAFLARSIRPPESRLEASAPDRIRVTMNMSHVGISRMNLSPSRDSDPSQDESPDRIRVTMNLSHSRDTTTH